MPLRNDNKLGLLQKHDCETFGKTGGEQAACTSKRRPHREAQEGSEVNGTMVPSGELLVGAGPIWVIAEAEARQRRQPVSIRSDAECMLANRLVILRMEKGGNEKWKSGCAGNLMLTA